MRLSTAHGHAREHACVDLRPTQRHVVRHCIPHHVPQSPSLPPSYSGVGTPPMPQKSPVYVECAMQGRKYRQIQCQVYKNRAYEDSQQDKRILQHGSNREGWSVPWTPGLFQQHVCRQSRAPSSWHQEEPAQTPTLQYMLAKSCRIGMPACFLHGRNVEKKKSESRMQIKRQLGCPLKKGFS